MHISVGLVARVRRLAFAAGLLRRPAPPTLPLLEYLGESGAADWLRASLTTFGRRVASFVPGHFDAYVRIHHPFEDGDGPLARTWRDLTALAGRDPHDPVRADDFALYGVPNAQAPVGTLPPPLIDVLVEHLRPATATPDACYFAAWEGFGDSPVPRDLEPTLELPHRRYHLFAGPIEAARTSFSASRLSHHSANLWWPADRAWCVATEIDFAWTYVGGTRAVADALLADRRLDAVETTASARW